ncbi:MAG: FkbM family methyltransferase [Planctomycetes bacterium]|nr:FkbM family methyltransferase [Planctomycetota bacterium]
MFQAKIKRLALRFFPDLLLQKLKKIHYAKSLREASLNGEPDLKVVRHLVGPGSRVIDIGANFGLYTRFLADLVQPGGRVYSIEPIPLTYEILTSNLKRLKLRNVEPFNVAVSDDDRTVTMEIPGYSSGGENFYEARIVTSAGEGLRSVKTEARALDSLFGDAGNIDFIKCDVEGHELACLQGAAAILENSQPAWLIEISGSPDRERTSASEVFRLMAGYGYSPYWFDGLHLRQRERGDRSVNYFFP